MAKMHYNRVEIGSLCERMEARGTSVMLRSQPELCRDLMVSSALLRWMLGQGMPPTSAEIEIVLT